MKKSAVIYTKPDANASQLGSLDKGTKVKAIGEADANGWLMIDYNGRAAYVEADRAGVSSAADDTDNVDNTDDNNESDNDSAADNKKKTSSVNKNNTDKKTQNKTDDITEPTPDPTPTPDPEPTPDTPKQSVTISGGDSLRYGRTKSWTVAFTDSTGAPIEKTDFKWNVVSEYEITQTVNGTKISLKYTVDRAVDKTFTLQVLDYDETILAEQTITFTA